MKCVVGPTLSPSRRLLHAFVMSDYVFGPYGLRVGRRAPVTGIALTAWNPRARRLSRRLNERRQQALAGLLRRDATWPGIGGWRGWTEAHLLARIDLDRAIALARRFDQTAIIVAVTGRPVQLRLISPRRG